MGVRQLAAFQHTNAVAEERERSLRRDTRIKLTQRTCRSITWVSKNFPARASRLFVDLFEPCLWQEYFTTHFQARRDILTMQFQRNRANSTDVRGDVFAGGAITTGRRTDQNAILIQNADGKAIKLQLTAPGDFFVTFQTIQYAFVESEKTLFIKNVVQRQHRYFMTDLAEGCQRRCTYALGW